MDFENILYKKANGIAWMVINRPEKRNALNRATRLEMAKVLEDTEKDPLIKVLVISGAGDKSFIAGSDLTELAKLTPLEMEAFSSTLGRDFTRDLRD